ncbi:hypothetical protein [Ferdinandcohnia sp. Marseille-Q9671]
MPSEARLAYDLEPMATEASHRPILFPNKEKQSSYVTGTMHSWIVLLYAIFH